MQTANNSAYEWFGHFIVSLEEQNNAIGHSNIEAAFNLDQYMHVKFLLTPGLQSGASGWGSHAESKEYALEWN